MGLENDPILSQVPVLKPELDFEVRDGIVYIIQYHNSKAHKFLRKFKKNIPEKTETKFDEISSRIFILIDNERSVYEIGQIISQEFGEDAEPLYERVVVYFDGLAANLNYITLKQRI